MQDNYTKIDNRFLDEVMQTLKSSELACCMAIFRKTAGWGKQSAAMSVDTISKITGITRRPTIIDALQSLESKGIVRAAKTAGKTTVYSFCYHLKSSFETSVQNRTSDTKNTSTENVTGTSVQNRTSTSVQNRTSDTKNTSTENVTGTSVQNRTSTSVQKRTSSSIYKEKEKKEKEKERDKGEFYRLNKKEIDKYIQYVIADSFNIRNEVGYRKTMIRQFIKEDQATIIEFEAWLLIYQCQELENKHCNHCFVSVTNNERFRGELLSVWVNENGKPSIKLRNADNSETKEYWFPNITYLDGFLENGGNG